MSINVGFLNPSYTLNKFNSIDNRLILNSYNNSNTILLNLEGGSYPDAVINYKDRYIEGIKSGIFVIEDVRSNLNILSMTKDYVKINPITLFKNDVNIKDLIITSNKTTYINSNLQINLFRPSDTFSILNLLSSNYRQGSSNNLNNKIIDVSYSNIDLRIGESLLNINKNNILVLSDLYIGKSNIIFTDTIKNNTTGGVVKIHNPYLIGLQIQSSLIYDSIYIKNDVSTYKNTSFKIERYNNEKNIVEISTCNLIENISPEKNFIIDKNGFIGIGSIQPTAPLSISKQNSFSSTIFEYNGIKFGDKFNISEHSYVGIGTTNSKSLLSLNRGDDLKENDIRKEPLIKMNIDYLETSNYITSNYKTTLFNVFTYSSNVAYCNLQSNITIYTSCNITSNNVLIDLLTTSLTIPFEQNNVIISNISLINNFYVFDNDMYSGVNNISNVIIDNTTVFLTLPNPIQVDFFNNYQIRNKINFPNIFYGSENQSDFTFSSNYVNNTSIYSYNYGYVLMTSNTSLVGLITNCNIPTYNASNFDIVKINKTVNTINTSSYFNYNFNLYVEKNRYLVNYIDTRPSLQKSPYFLYATSNNNFSASLSSYNTLSLGSLSPIDGKYLLYAPARSLLNIIETDTLTTITNSNLHFSYCNLIDIDSVISNSNISKLLTTDNALIDTLKVNNISLNTQFASVITTSNLVFTTLASDYISVSSSNFHINTLFSIGKNNNSKQLNNNSMAKITIDSSIVSSNKFYKNNKGLIITNVNNISSNIIVNPSIQIYGNNNSKPYINLSTSSSEYYMRINSNLYQYNINEWSDAFQLCCDTVSGTSRENYYNLTQPHILQHIKLYNLLTIGENNSICIDVLDRSSTNIIQPITNSTNKVSIGLPIGILDTQSATYSEWPQYFKNNIINDTNNPYMLNIYGNINISSIYGKPIIRGLVDNGVVKNSSLEKVSVGIGGDPIIDTTLYVYGNGVFNSNLSTSNNFDVYGNAHIYHELEVNGRLQADQGVTTTSDINIKKDFMQISNALDKLCSISGYTYTRKDTGLRESGLIAQEVYNILPEVIYKKNNSLLSISYGNMSGIIIEAIKELKDKVSAIEARINGMDLS